jgi:hypothetical protein
MVRTKNTQSKRGPQGEELPTSARKITRMEQAAREAKGTFLKQVDTKGKAVIDRWEREVNTKRQGKAWVELIQEADGIRDPGATQPRKTLYHKTVEEAWRTKMLISKLRADKNETNRDGKPRPQEGNQRNPEPPQQLGGQRKKHSRGPEEPKRKNRTTGWTIPTLPSLCPPHGHHSSRPTRNTNQHQKDAHGGAEKGERGKEGRR